MENNVIDLRKMKKMSWWNVVQYSDCTICISEKQNQFLKENPVDEHNFYKECVSRNIKIEIKS